MIQCPSILKEEKTYEVESIMVAMGYDVIISRGKQYYTFWKTDWSKSVQIECIPTIKTISSIKKKLRKYLGGDFMWELAIAIHWNEVQPIEKFK
jgi:hypothetical protein